MKISSPAFRSGEPIPQKYSREGGDKSPPLSFSGVPAKAQSLALIMDDPDAPRGTFTHWVVFDLDPKTVELAEDFSGGLKPALDTSEAPESRGQAPENARHGVNDWGESEYGGPRPPTGEHRYFFRLFALDKKLNLPPGATRQRVEQAMQGHVLDQAETMGRYAAQRQPQPAEAR